MSARRMLPFVLINIVVSAVVVLAILYWWDVRQNQGVEKAVSTPIASPTQVFVAAATIEQASETVNQPEEDEPTVYAVQSGDTLGSISRNFEVPIDDIMLVNDIANPNFLQVGQELVIPIGGIPTATPLPTSTPTAAAPPTPIPTGLPTEGEAEVEIAEVTGAGNLEEEAISVANSGSRAIALLGWRLEDEGGRAYTFGQVTLFGEGAAILIHTAQGQDGASDLFWGFDEPILAAGETVKLVDAEGTVRSTYTIPGD